MNVQLILELVARYTSSKFRASACCVSKATYTTMIAVSMENPIFAKYYIYTTYCLGCNDASPRHTCRRVLENRLQVASKPRAYGIVKIVSDYHIFVRLKIKPPFDISCKYACVDVIKVLHWLEFTGRHFNDRLYDNGIYNAIIAHNNPVRDYLFEHDPRGSMGKK